MREGAKRSPLTQLEQLLLLRLSGELLFDLFGGAFMPRVFVVALADLRRDRVMFGNDHARFFDRHRMAGDVA